MPAKLALTDSTWPFWKKNKPKFSKKKRGCPSNGQLLYKFYNIKSNSNSRCANPNSSGNYCSYGIASIPIMAVMVRIKAVMGMIILTIMTMGVAILTMFGIRVPFTFQISLFVNITTNWKITLLGLAKKWFLKDLLLGIDGENIRMHQRFRQTNGLRQLILKIEFHSMDFTVVESFGISLIPIHQIFTYIDCYIEP